jgi:hypothetical protein
MTKKFLLISRYQMWKAKEKHGMSETMGMLYKDGERVGYWEEYDREEDMIHYDHFIREDYYPYEEIKAEQDKLREIMKGLPKK